MPCQRFVMRWGNKALWHLTPLAWEHYRFANTNLETAPGTLSHISEKLQHQSHTHICRRLSYTEYKTSKIEHYILHGTQDECTSCVLSGLFAWIVWNSWDFRKHSPLSSQRTPLVSFEITPTPVYRQISIWDDALPSHFNITSVTGPKPTLRWTKCDNNVNIHGCV